jgi:hypothetical protein
VLEAKLDGQLKNRAEELAFIRRHYPLGKGKGEVIGGQ